MLSTGTISSAPASSSPTSEIFFQLEENFRLNPQLCNFVELIYQKRFQPMHSRREIAHLGQQIQSYVSTMTSSPTATVSRLAPFLNGMSEVLQFSKPNLMNSPIT